MTTPLPHLIWIDSEMTGLDVVNDALVEIAVLVTDSDLNVIGEGIDVVIACQRRKVGRHERICNPNAHHIWVDH
jgi:oligoribonuclease